jgi:aspartate/methionine/tyrosine aminotransferase
MIIINNPNNPTGAPIPDKVMEGIADFAAKRDIILFSDEVYRPLWHSLPAGTTPPPPATSLGHKKTVVTGSMSKAFALAGIRLGWVVSPDSSIIDAVAAARDYTTISVSKLDDRVATYALSPAVQPSLVRRNTELAAHNLKLVKAFIEKYPSVCCWIEPRAGTTAFIQFRTKGKPIVDTEFCLDLLEKTKVFLVPGSHCFGRGEDFEGYVRMGYVSETSVLEEALRKLGEYVECSLL